MVPLNQVSILRIEANLAHATATSENRALTQTQIAGSSTLS